MVAAWIATEFETLDLGDTRRERRAGIIMDDLSHMAESQPEAAKSTAALKATYRFANNQAITPDAILRAHNQASIQRTTQYKRVTLASDTTDIDLTNPTCQVKGAGPLESEDKRGFFMHPLYALTEDGVPLGIVDQEIWTREHIRTDLSPEEKARLRKQTVFEEKESQRWLAMLQSGEQIALANPGTEYTVVGDSESDIHEIFMEVAELPGNCHFVVRGCQDRAVVKNGTYLTVDAVLAKAPIQFINEVEISERVSKIVGETRVRRKSREPRLAQLSIRAARMTIRGPARVGGKLPNATLNVVEVVELDPPEGEDPIRWVLFTTLPINSESEIERVISTYACRWHIELFFKTLKSGLKVENLQYETLAAYLTAFALYVIVAWRVEYLKGAARHDGNASVDQYFAAEEWQPAYIVCTKCDMLPEEPPTMDEFMKMIAELGGWQRKKSQGPPGSMTIWRGIRRMETYADAFQAFQKLKKRCGV